MNSNNYIEFKKERDLGSIITDTFKFIRENWKAYFTTLFKVVGPVILVALLVLVMYLLSASKLFNNFGVTPNAGPSAVFSQFESIFAWMFIMMFVFVVLYSLLAMTSLFFIKSYIENKGATNFSDIRANVLKNLWRFLGLGFITSIGFIVGFYLCLVPGIYIGSVFALAAPIMVFENKGIGDTLSHCFTLIKDHWWETFGCLLVIWLLLMILGQAFSIPALIYYFIKMGTAISDGNPENIGQVFDTTYIILNVISYLFQFMLYSVPLIATTFIYYDLNEQKSLTGTIEKIDSLGQ